MNTEQLLSSISKAIENGQLPLRVFNIPELFALKKSHLFTKYWNYLGHESEIPNPGDNVQRYIVDEAFIVSRDENNTISVLLNACRHRGRKICSSEKGNTRNFSCPYHGWVYALDGALVDVPYEAQCYGKNEINYQE